MRGEKQGREAGVQRPVGVRRQPCWREAAAASSASGGAAAASLASTVQERREKQASKGEELKKQAGTFQPQTLDPIPRAPPFSLPRARHIFPSRTRRIFPSRARAPFPRAISRSRARRARSSPKRRLSSWAPLSRRGIAARRRLGAPIA
jgi:hypothetical protein